MGAASLLSDLLRYPDEFLPLWQVRRASKSAARLPDDPHLRFCYRTLSEVSRSFAIVIQQLHVELRDAVCVFYLVLRALDTVEDDMKLSEETKLPVLRSFHQRMKNPSWKFLCGDGHYLVLMQNFEHVSLAYGRLKKEYRDVIEDITRRMGAGMATFIKKEVHLISEYDEYCHYVAGLVGVGLSKLFLRSGLERKKADEEEEEEEEGVGGRSEGNGRRALNGVCGEAESEETKCCLSDALSNNMGLFLQKTNIIRDYLEDIQEEPRPRMFWPKEIWGKYASQLEDFESMIHVKKEQGSLLPALSPSSSPPSLRCLHCLNEMVTNALSHAPLSLEYLSLLKQRDVFRFCAIPQIMAIGTLSLCYNNERVFRGVVKMRKGLSAKIMMRTDTIFDVCLYFHRFADDIDREIPDSDPNSKSTRRIIHEIKLKCQTLCPSLTTALNDESRSSASYWRSNALFLPFLVLIISMLVVRLLVFLPQEMK